MVEDRDALMERLAQRIADQTHSVAECGCACEGRHGCPLYWEAIGALQALAALTAPPAAREPDEVLLDQLEGPAPDAEVEAAVGRYRQELLERRRKSGDYWLTPEGRSEIRETWDDPTELVPTLLRAVERSEVALRAAQAAVLREVRDEIHARWTAHLTPQLNTPSKDDLLNFLGHATGVLDAKLAALAAPEARDDQ